MTESTTELAQKEFKVIRDLLLVPLKPDSPSEELLEHRKWKGGCIPVGLPDLVPINTVGGEPPEGFCKLENNRLVVIVQNRGNATAPKSTTRVVYIDLDTFKSKSHEKLTEEIPAGKFVKLDFDPPICSSSKCLVIITVNAKFEMVESNFINNVAIGLCIPGNNPA